MPETSTTATPPNAGPGGRILLVGGYGAVGRRLAGRLLATTNATVTVAGRRPDAARRTAAELGVRAGGIGFDVRNAGANAETIERHDLIVVCLDLPDLAVPRLAAAAGRDYLDLTADADAIAEQRSLHALAASTGARMVPGVGLIPGLSNLLARDAVDAAGGDGVDEIATLASLPLVGDHGPAALDFVVATLARPPRGGATARPRLRRFPPNAPPGAREGGAPLAMTFPFPDRVALPRTLGVASASTWLALEPRWATRALALLARSPLVAAHRPAAPRRAAVGAVARFASGRSPGRARVDVVATGPGAPRRASVEGVGQSAVTAAAVAALVQLWARDRWTATPPGVHLPEEAFDPGEVFARLPEHGLTVERAAR